jgi:hypothetical protein
MSELRMRQRIEAIARRDAEATSRPRAEPLGGSGPNREKPA